MTVEFQVMAIAFIRGWYMIQAQASTGAQREEFTRRAKMYDRFPGRGEASWGVSVMCVAGFTIGLMALIVRLVRSVIG